jgi:uncharacterized SAM-binding protein YcdF (DUF218 family)
VFWLKKLVSFFLMPLPLCLALLALGLALGRSPRRARLGWRLAVAGAALLFLFSNRCISTLLLRPLEAQYPPVPEIAAGHPAPPQIAGCRFVAVLGGGNSDVPGLPATSQLSTSALARIVEAVRILRSLPDARLLVSGPGEPGHPTHAAMLAAAAESLGVEASRITLIESARDTEDESHEVARLAGAARTALVTSAWHMPRAAHLLREAGVDAVPCPVDYVARDRFQLRWDDLTWDSESLVRSTMAAHEWLGLLWLRLRGA